MPRSLDLDDMTEPRRRRGCCLGCLGRLVLWTLFLILLVTAAGLLSFVYWPPFGASKTANIMLVGLDEIDQLDKTQTRRSDSLILCAARMQNPRSVTLISIPRDSRVHIPGYRGDRKINAAYALGKASLLKKTLADPDVMDAQLSYYLIFSSTTVHRVVDALGGVQVDVPNAMNYDDNWQNLHIHLKAGMQTLNGAQCVGYLRWRKDNHGGHNSRLGGDFNRTERQRALLAAITRKMKTPEGLKHSLDAYKAFRTNTMTDLNLRQLIMLAIAARQINSQIVPSTPRTLGGVSYVEVDWPAARAMWQKAIQ